MPSLLQRWGDAPAPEELVNAALGIAALGGDLPASVSPPLNRAWIDAMLAKAEARMTAPRPVLQASTPQRATITALVAEQLEQDPTTLAMVGHLVGAPEILKSKWLACVEEQAPQSKDAKPVDPGDWYAGLQGAQRRTVDQECPRTTISS